MTLLQEIQDLQKEMLPQIPEDVLEAFQKATEDLIARGVGKNALRIADPIPDFELKDSSDRMISSSQILKKGPAVISFYRGGWCPYCNLELQALQRRLPEIQKLGATLLAISPELPDHSLTTREKNELAFPVLTDPDNQVAKDFGLVFELAKEVDAIFMDKFEIDLGKLHGTGKAELPLPATFVVDRKGIIRFAFVDVDYTKRAEPKDIVETLEQIKD